jgi:hypothetical protein
VATENLLESFTPTEKEEGEEIIVEIETGEEREPQSQNEKHEEEQLTDEEAAEEQAAASDEEREAIRERRRQERQMKKNYRKEKEESYKREIEGLRRQVAEMNEWKNSVEHRRVNSGVAQLDKALRESMDAIEVAKKAIREATETQNGEALVDAQELYYVARKRAEDLGRLRQNITRQMQAPPQQNIDPAVVRNAQGWMDGKEWYDPTGRDPDSRVALTIDNAMAEEGWDPRTPEYWSELDNRLKKYLPHRYNSGYTGSNESKGRKTPTGGSSQTVSAKSSSREYRLSPERVRAMKEAGMWDDPDKRKKMIQRYMEMDKTNQRG